MRDHITPGKIEEILLDMEPNVSTLFTNGWLAEYAKDIAKRLK